MNNNIGQFTIEVSSDLDYEKMVINLNFCKNQIATLNCDKGINKAEIKILDRDEDKVVWTFNCQEFLKILQEAYEKLKNSLMKKTKISRFQIDELHLKIGLIGP